MSFNPNQLSPPAFGDPWVEKDGTPTSDFYNWFLITLLPAIQNNPSLSGPTPAYASAGLNAVVGPVDLPLGSLSTGKYRISVYLRVTTADGVSSSVAPVLSFTDDTIACTMTGAALTADMVTRPISQVFVVAVDQPGPIQFSTTYASNTPGAMVYKAFVAVERLL